MNLRGVVLALSANRLNYRAKSRTESETRSSSPPMPSQPSSQFFPSPLNANSQRCTPSFVVEVIADAFPPPSTKVFSATFASPSTFHPNVISGSVSDDDAKELFPDGWETPLPYMRIVKQP